MRFLIVIYCLLGVAYGQQNVEPNPQQNPEGNLEQNPEEQAYIYALDAYNYASRQTSEFYQKREYTLASKLFYRYLEKFPSHENTPGAKYYMAVCYIKIGRLKEARVVFDNIIKKHKEGEFVVKSAKYLAYDAEFSKDFKRAQRYYKVVAAKSKNGLQQYEAKFNVGLCALKLNRKDEAVGYFEKAVKEIPVISVYHQQSLQKLAHIQRENGEVEASLKTFKALTRTEIAPELQSEGLFFMGLILYQQGKFKEADTAYKRVLVMQDPKWKPQALISVMSVKYAEADYKGVIRNALTPGVILPDDLRARKDILAGQSYLKLKEYREAISSFNLVIKRYPNTGEAFEASYRKILCYYNLKSGLVAEQVNIFIKKYEKIYRDHLFMHKALLLQAETLFEEKEYKAAVASYRKIDIALVGEGNGVVVHYKKAWCYHELGQHSEAVESFSKFLKSYPDDPRKLQILNIRAQNYANLGNKKSAIADFEEVIKMSPKTLLAAASTQSAARLHKELEEIEKMITKYDSLLNDFEDLEKPVRTNAHYWNAWGYFKLEEFKKALPHLKKAKELDDGQYAKKLALIDVLSNYQLKDKPAMVKALNEANKQGIGNDIPMGIYRWVGIQCFKAGEFSDAQVFLSMGVTKLNPSETPVYYWRSLARAQYENKHYQWALQSITHAMNLDDDPAQLVNMKLYKALCQNGLNKPEEAKATAVASLKENPSGRTKAMLLKLLGDIYFKEQNYKEAAISFASITEFYDDTEILPYSIAMIVKALEASNKPSDAEIFRGRLEKEFPDYKFPK